VTRGHYTSVEFISGSSKAQFAGFSVEEFSFLYKKWMVSSFFLWLGVDEDIEHNAE
jgi:hypothetical protein